MEPDLGALILRQLRELRCAETQIAGSLRRLAARSSNLVLARALSGLGEEGAWHADRLMSIGRMLNANIAGGACPGLLALIEEGDRASHAGLSPEVADAAIVSAARRMKHYEIASYEAAMRGARALGLSEVFRVLGENYREDRSGDERLQGIAAEEGMPIALASFRGR